jgi:hypothetical protein
MRTSSRKLVTKGDKHHNVPSHRGIFSPCAGFMASTSDIRSSGFPLFQLDIGRRSRQKKRPPELARLAAGTPPDAAFVKHEASQRGAGHWWGALNSHGCRLLAFADSNNQHRHPLLPLGR